MNKIKIERALVDGIKADLVKGEVKVTLRMPLETGLAIRADLSEMAEYEQPISVEIRSWQNRLPLGDRPAGVDEVTLTATGAGGEVLSSVTLGGREAAAALGEH